MKPIRICNNRNCEEPVPEWRRSDAKHCCDQHAIEESNLRKNDDREEVATRKAINKVIRIAKDFINRGKKDIPKVVLEFLDFDFEVLTKLVRTNPNTNTTIYNLYSYRIFVKDDIYNFKKI